MAETALPAVTAVTQVPPADMRIALGNNLFLYSPVLIDQDTPDHER